jgi:glucan phosphoethanolaminetransferase (alkaline phosphatase superfamily)
MQHRQSQGNTPATRAQDISTTDQPMKKSHHQGAIAESRTPISSFVFKGVVPFLAGFAVMVTGNSFALKWLAALGALITWSAALFIYTESQRTGVMRTNIFGVIRRKESPRLFLINQILFWVLWVAGCIVIVIIATR